MSAAPRPQAVVIAGPNGAGKTTAAPQLLQAGVGIEAFVNADVIAQGLAGFRPQSAAVEAGRIMLQRLDELVEEGADFAFESTLSGRSVRGRILDLTARGYGVHLCYLWLPSPEMAVERVRRRVESGGHDVPEPVIRRRFWRSLMNFEQIYRPIVDSWHLYDGSRLPQLPLVAHGTATDQPKVVDSQIWSVVHRQIEEHA
jgi:predicted ABC-type ATPase